MAGGFTFCGVDIEKYHLYYAPEGKDTYIYGAGEYKVHDSEFDGHDGGYWYGATLEPKEFTLRCFFEDATLKDFDAWDHLFGRNKGGKLVFDDRPHLWYMARVVEYNRPE